jgi:hypothetical protein
MSFFETFIRALLAICAIVLVYFLTIWVLGVIGIAIPQQVLSIIMVMLVLVAILILGRLFWPFLRL